MNAHIICLASAKGGSGKTSLIATFATFLSKIGKRILLIDADFATNGLTLLFLKEVRVKAELVRSTTLIPVGLCATLVERKLPDIVKLGEFLDLIPATFDLNAGISNANETVRKSFQDLLSSLREDYDFIFIDAQAGADDMAKIAMCRSVSDEVVIVTEYDPMSAAGVERLKALLREDLTYDRTWVLLNKILPEFAKSFSDFLEVAKYLNPIPWDASVVRAYARRQLAIDTESGNEHTISVLQTLKGLCGESIQLDLAKWVQTRAAAIRQPIEDQYADAEKEMEYLLSCKSRLAQRRQMNRMMWKGMFFTSFILFTGAIIYFGQWYMNSEPFKMSPSLLWISAALFFMIISVMYVISAVPELLPRIFDFRGVKNQVNEFRYERQFELLSERLKRLEVLRTLDPEVLLGKPEFRQEACKLCAPRKMYNME